MKKHAWPRIPLTTEDGREVTAIAPVVVSASRATDIPSFFPDWFYEQLEKGYVQWINPFNGKPLHVAFCNTRVIVFWSKYPRPLFPYLEKISRKGIDFLFHLTINDYEKEGFESRLPPLESRISSVHELADRIGKERVLWRFDPLILSGDLGAEELLKRIERIGDRIAGDVSRLTVSYLCRYPSVIARMERLGIHALVPHGEVVHRIGTKLEEIRKKWDIEVVSCAEHRDMSTWGIMPGSCIDPVYLMKVFPRNRELIRFITECTPGVHPDDTQALRRALKDPGQRPLCGCMLSKDIGSYGTCRHGCVYCYAGRTVRTPRRV